MRIIGVLAMAAAALAVGTGLTACGGGDDSATPEEELCSALDGFRSSLDGGAGSEHRLVLARRRRSGDRGNGRRGAGRCLRRTGGDLGRRTELQASAESLQTALGDFPSPGSIQAITTGLATIREEAGEQAIEDLDCDSSS